MGARSKIVEWETPEKITLLRGWRRDGLKMSEIAGNVGVTEKTLFNWCDKNENIKQALKMGKVEANFIIENALFAKARSGNMTAIIFWLKNNWRNKYSDTQRTELEEMLTKSQIAKVKADTEISKARAEMLNGSGEDATNAVGTLMDMLLDAGKDSKDADEEIQNKPKKYLHR